MDSGSASRFQTVTKVSQHLVTASLAITISDWLTCLHIEYFRIWRSKLTVAKLLYLFTRYWSIAAAVVNVWVDIPDRTAESCSHIYKLVVILPTISVLASEAILAVRTYAFLGRDARLLAIMCLMLLGELAYSLYFLISPNGLTQAPIHGVVGACAASATPGHTHLSMGLFMYPAIFDLFVTVITLVRAVQLWRDGLRSSWLQFFVREGLIYFLVLTTLNIANMVFFLQPYQPLQPIIGFPTRQISAILACRLILSLRNPKVLGPQRSVGSSFFHSTGLETRHNDAASASAVPVLPQTTDQLQGQLEQGGVHEVMKWEGPKAQDIGEPNAKANDDNE